MDSRGGEEAWWPKSLGALCGGDVAELNVWLDSAGWRRIGTCLLLMALGTAVFGFSAGWWRSPLMGVYVAVKWPLLILLVLAFNGMLNGMLGLLLGSGLGFRQTFLACLMAFAVFGMILGSLAPVVWFYSWNLAPPSEPGAVVRHAGHLLVQTAVIAFAGVVAHVKLFGVLLARCRDVRVALGTLCGWLAGNLFVGAQLSWNLRPFFGSPSLPVRFLRDDPLDGTFYEAVWRSAVRLLSAQGPVAVPLIIASLLTVLILAVAFARPVLREASIGLGLAPSRDGEPAAPRRDTNPPN